MQSFIETQFGHCPLIWMFHGRGVNDKIKHLKNYIKRALTDNNSSFKGLLKKDNEQYITN